MGIKGEIDRNTITAGDFTTPLTSMDRYSRHKINKQWPPKKLKEFIIIKPVLYEMLKGLKKMKKIKNMYNKVAINTYQQH